MTEIPFRPTARHFAGFPVPSSVPPGLRLELSRSKIMPARRRRPRPGGRWLNERYDECVETLADEHAAFESTFLNVEADGSTWICHLSLVGEGGRGHDPEASSVDEAHDDYGCRAKMRGWEELRPMFMVTPDHVPTQLEQWGRTGNV